MVGFVEAASSEACWFVEGVSGRGIDASASAALDSSGEEFCWISGNWTASVDFGEADFLFLRARRVGQLSSGFENQGSYSLLGGNSG